MNTTLSHTAKTSRRTRLTVMTGDGYTTCSPPVRVRSANRSLNRRVIALLSDLIYTWIDPRIDFESREV